MVNLLMTHTIPNYRNRNIPFLYFSVILTISLNQLNHAIADSDFSLHDCSLALSSTCTNSTFSFLSMIECAQQNLDELPIQCDYLLGSMLSSIFADCENDLRVRCYDYDESSWLDCLMENTKILSPLCKHQFENYIEVGLPCVSEANSYCSENNDLDGVLTCLGGQDTSKLNIYCQDTLRGLSQCTSSNYSVNGNQRNSNSDLMHPPQIPIHADDGKRDGIIDFNPLKPSPGGNGNGDLPRLTPDKPSPMITDKNKERSNNPSKTAPDRGISKTGPATVVKSGVKSGDSDVEPNMLRKLLVIKEESDVEGKEENEDNTENAQDQNSAKKRNKKKSKKLSNVSGDPIENQAGGSRHRRLDVNTSNEISKTKIREFARRGGGKLNTNLPTREEWLASRKQWLDGMHKKVERVSTIDTMVTAGRQRQRHRRTAASEENRATRRRQLNDHSKVKPIHSDLVPLPLDTPCWAKVISAIGDSKGDSLQKAADGLSGKSAATDMIDGDGERDGEPPLLHDHDDVANAIGDTLPSSDVDDVHGGEGDSGDSEGLISNVNANDKQTSMTDVIKDSDSSPTGSPTVISKSTVDDADITSHDSASSASGDKQRQQDAGGEDWRPHSGGEVGTDDEDDYDGIWMGYSDSDSYSGGSVLLLTAGGLAVIGGIAYYVFRVRQRMAGEDRGYRAATAITATWTADDESSSHPLRSSGEVELGENPFH